METEESQGRQDGHNGIKPPGFSPYKIMLTMSLNGFAKRLDLQELFVGFEYRLPEIAERFWSKVDVYEENECWIWTGREGPGGYGQLRFELGGRRVVLVSHRFAYALAHPDQAIPATVQVQHCCGEKLCVNPAHLILRDRHGRPLGSDGNGLARFKDRLP
jgi:hypothetical protein